MAKFTGKTVLIADGTTDIGLAIAKLFLKEGARIAISGRDARRVEDAARTVGPEVIAICANIASQSDMANVAAQLQTSYGKIDFVFASAGIVKDDCGEFNWWLQHKH